MCKTADKIIKFAEVHGDIGAMLMFERLELFQCGINVTVREAVVLIE